jgi:hypothetical protein
MELFPNAEEWYRGQYKEMSSEQLQRQITAIAELADSDQRDASAYYKFISPLEQAHMMKEELVSRTTKP